MLSHIIKSIDFHFFKLKNLFEELQSYSYFTKDYRKLIKYLKKYLEEKYEEFIEISISIRKSVDNSDETYNSANYKKLADFFLVFIEIFNFFIQNIRNSKNTQFHTANFIIIKKFLDKDAKFLILPLSENSINYGYSNSLEVFQKAKEKYDSDHFNGEIEIFDLFVIPHFNQEDIFMNSSLAHEIGHYREKKHKIYKKIGKELQTEKIIGWGSKAFIELVESELKKEKDRLGRDLDTNEKHSFRINLFQNWNSRLGDWIKEIISDIIGIKIFGLPSFFGFIEALFLTNPTSKGDEKHPPNWLRLKFMFQEIEENILCHLKGLTFLGEDLKTKLQNRIGIIKKHLLKETTSKDEISNTIIKLIDSKSVKPKIKIYITNLTEQNKLISYSYEKVSNIKEIIDLMLLLKNYVTPNEIIIDRKKPLSRPANIISILNASWLFYLFNIKFHYDLLLNDKERENPESRSKVLQKLNNLTLKAIELSKIHERIERKNKDENSI